MGDSFCPAQEPSISVPAVTDIREEERGTAGHMTLSVRALTLLLLAFWPIPGVMSAPPDSARFAHPYGAVMRATEQDSLVRSLLLRGRREGLSSRTLVLPKKVTLRFWELDRTMQAAVTFRVQRCYYLTAQKLRDQLDLTSPHEGFEVWVFPTGPMMRRWLRLERDVYAVAIGDRYIFIPYEAPMPVIIHEMVHVLTFASYLPEWFAEGLASYLFHDSYMFRDLGYAEYRAILHEIERRLGKDGFKLFCMRVIHNRATERALWEMVGTTYEQLRQDVEHTAHEAR